MSEIDHYYEIFGLKSGASEQEIVWAYEVPYDQCLRSDVGYLLAFLAFCLLTVAPIVFANDKTTELQVKALPGIPEDLLIVYGTGATHAERGRTTYRISADGKATCEKRRRSGATVARQLKQYQLTKEELKLIIKKVNDVHFFNLKEHCSNPKIRDGSSSYITLTMEKQSHSVGLLNTSIHEFSEIANLITTIIDKKKPMTTSADPTP